jgi:hypothetical protein
VLGQAITAFWQPVPITPQAIADDPQLATMQTWDLMTMTTGDWAQAGLRGDFEPIQSAQWYHHPLAGNTRPDPALMAAHPATAYDTYVTAPSDDGVTGAPAILGNHPTGTMPDFGGTTGIFSVTWGDLIVDSPGTYQIARWTFPQDRLPTVYWLGDPPTLPGSSNTSQINPDSTAIVTQIPEPSLLSVLAALSLLVRSRPLRQLNTCSLGNDRLLVNCCLCSPS